MRTLRTLSFLFASALAAGAAQEVAPDPGAAAARPADVTMLRLRDGRILWGTVVEHDAEGIAFRRLENGGRVELPWSFLDPDEDRGLRMRFGYVDAVAEEVTTAADRLVLRDGTELVGRIVRRTDEHVYVKRAESTVPVAKSLIQSAGLTQAPALEIFTKEELYQEKVFELQSRLLRSGTPGAEANFELAQFCERLFDYAHALEHYRHAGSSDPAYRADAVRAAIARTEVKAALQEQVDHLAGVDLQRARKHFDRALEGLTTFPELYPRSPLMEDWNKLRERVLRDQERELRAQVVRSWHRWAERLVRQKARELESYDAAIDYLEEGLGEEIVAGVHTDLQKIAPEIQPEEVRRLFDEREGGRVHQASYGYGTWLLGEERALAELPEPGAEVAIETGRETQAEARKRLEDRLKRYFENQALAKRSQQSTREGEDPEAFWASTSSSSRAQWMLAYYAEYGGAFRVDGIRRSPCRECGGKGVREVIFSGAGLVSGNETSGGLELIACPTCHRLGIMRRVRYR